MAVLESIRNLFFTARPEEPEIIIAAAETTYELRNVDVRDIDTLLRLNLRCFKNGENYTKHTFNYLLTQPRSLGYGAVTPSGDMAGFVLVMDSGEGTAHLTTIAVAPEHRRRGVGDMLLERVESSLQAKGVSTVVLEVRASNIGAQNLYRSNGYVVTQRMNRYYANGEDGYLMIRSIS